MSSNSSVLLCLFASGTRLSPPATPTDAVIAGFHAAFLDAGFRLLVTQDGADDQAMPQGWPGQVRQLSLLITTTF